MPQDWKSVEVILGDTSDPVSMTWYGENLWIADFSNDLKPDKVEVCATDYCENMTCKSIE